MSSRSSRLRQVDHPGYSKFIQTVNVHVHYMYFVRRDFRDKGKPTPRSWTEGIERVPSTRRGPLTMGAVGPTVTAKDTISSFVRSWTRTETGFRTHKQVGRLLYLFGQVTDGTVDSTDHPRVCRRTSHPPVSGRRRRNSKDGT